MSETVNVPEDVNAELEKRITKRDLFMSYLLWTFFSHSSYNYERLQALGFAHSMIPVIKRLYGSDKEAVRAALTRHLVFYNTAPDVGSMINGATIAMEEQKANGRDVPDTAINSMKTGLMGPMAGVGDTISQGILVPLYLALAIGITGINVSQMGESANLEGITGNPLGPVVYFVLVSITSLGIGYVSYTQGYYRGRGLVTQVFKSGLMDRVIVGASVLGNMVLGGLSASFVLLNLGLAFNAGGQPIRLQQDFLDKIMPGLLPLALVVFTWWVLKRGFHPIKLLVIYVVIALAGAFPFFGRAPYYVTDACGSAVLQPYGPCTPEWMQTDDGGGEG